MTNELKNKETTLEKKPGAGENGSGLFAFMGVFVLTER
jgi:hypothetical protein